MLPINKNDRNALTMPRTVTRDINNILFYQDLCPVDELTILKNTVYSKNNLFYSNKQRILTKECKPDLLSDF